MITRWLRENAQQYLLRDAQARVARAHGQRPPPSRGSFFWRRIFVPIYRLTPWPIRRRLLAAMPGSHRKHWSTPTRPVGPAI
ncbi:hypothetical protein ACFXJ8_27150 [Nonomuraea sp. NPDC059194]|uniref:hypothetical protein n=1 Tax=Nonomuraea sp. NPDC059194 TaxID=3346764 RepID=UPI00368B36F4